MTPSSPGADAIMAAAERAAVDAVMREGITVLNAIAALCAAIGCICAVTGAPIDVAAEVGELAAASVRARCGGRDLARATAAGRA